MSSPTQTAGLDASDQQQMTEKMNAVAHTAKTKSIGKPVESVSNKDSEMGARETPKGVVATDTWRKLADRMADQPKDVQDKTLKVIEAITEAAVEATSAAAVPPSPRGCSKVAAKGKGMLMLARAKNEERLQEALLCTTECVQARMVDVVDAATKLGGIKDPYFMQEFLLLSLVELVSKNLVPELLSNTCMLESFFGALAFMTPAALWMTSTALGSISSDHLSEPLVTAIVEGMHLKDSGYFAYFLVTRFINSTSPDMGTLRVTLDLLNTERALSCCPRFYSLLTSSNAIKENGRVLSEVMRTMHDAPFVPFSQNIDYILPNDLPLDTTRDVINMIVYRFAHDLPVDDNKPGVVLTTIGDRLVSSACEAIRGGDSDVLQSHAQLFRSVCEAVDNAAALDELLSHTLTQCAGELDDVVASVWVTFMGPPVFDGIKKESRVSVLRAVLSDYKFRSAVRQIPWHHSFEILGGILGDQAAEGFPPLSTSDAKRILCSAMSVETGVRSCIATFQTHEGVFTRLFGLGSPLDLLDNVVATKADTQDAVACFFAKYSKEAPSTLAPSLEFLKTHPKCVHIFLEGNEECIVRGVAPFSGEWARLFSIAHERNNTKLRDLLQAMVAPKPVSHDADENEEDGAESDVQSERKRREKPEKPKKRSSSEKKKKREKRKHADDDDGDYEECASSGARTPRKKLKAKKARHTGSTESEIDL